MYIHVAFEKDKLADKTCIILVDNIANHLMHEIKLSKIQIDVFLLILKEGKMDAYEISKKIGITTNDALLISNALVELGGFISLSDKVFETMHPRFSIINMYRNICEKNNTKFMRNDIVDNIAALLEKDYYLARTK